MNKAMRMAATVAVTAFGFGAVAAAAQATPTVGAPGSPGGPFSITSTVTGSNHTFNVGGATVTCTGATFGDASNPITGPGAPANTATFKPTYTGCSLSIIGQKCAATVTINDSWTIAAKSYLSGGGGPGTDGAQYAGDVTLNGAGTNALISVTSCGLNCNISVANQVVTPSPANSLTATDVGTGTVGDASVRLAGTANNIAFTSAGCPGVAASGSNAVYTIVGSVTVPGVYIYGS